VQGPRLQCNNSWRCMVQGCNATTVGLYGPRLQCNNSWLNRSATGSWLGVTLFFFYYPKPNRQRTWPHPEDHTGGYLPCSSSRYLLHFRCYFIGGPGPWQPVTILIKHVVQVSITSSYWHLHVICHNKMKSPGFHLSQVAAAFPRQETEHWCFLRHLLGKHTNEPIFFVIRYNCYCSW